VEGSGTDAITAADQYKRARELFYAARENLVKACAHDRDAINMGGIAQRAGLHRQTLYGWVEREKRSNGGNTAQPV
jgi:transposase-like protein